MAELIRASSRPPSRRLPRRPTIQESGAVIRRVLGFKWSAWLRDLRWYRVLAATFVIAVVLPTTAATLYYSLIAAGQFESSVRLAIYAVGNNQSAALDILGTGKSKSDVNPKRGADALDEKKVESAPDQSGVLRQVLAKMNSGNLVQGDGKDPYLVVNYIQSRAIVADLDGDHWLESMYRRDRADLLARLRPNPSREDLWRYFQRRIDARVDSATHLVTIAVRAFTPEDAKALADRIVLATESLVNKIRERQTSDTITSATKRLNESEARYISALAAVRALREDVGVINPGESAKALAKSLTELKVLRISLETELQTRGAVLSARSPVRQALNARIGAVDAEVADLERQIAGQPDKGQAVASYLVDFENRETDRLLAQAQYQQAISAFDRAQVAAETQGVFLASLTPPGLPEEASHPRGARIVLTIFLIAFAGWSIGCLGAAGIRDQVT